jgi:hypothetical protein
VQHARIAVGVVADAVEDCLRVLHAPSPRGQSTRRLHAYLSFGVDDVESHLSVNGQERFLTNDLLSDEYVSKR